MMQVYQTKDGFHYDNYKEALLHEMNNELTFQLLDSYGNYVTQLDDADEVIIADKASYLDMVEAIHTIPDCIDGVGHWIWDEKKAKWVAVIDFANIIIKLVQNCPCKDDEETIQYCNKEWCPLRSYCLRTGR